ncbi:uncharacterized protein LOC143048080 [Mytilus galloprovincialis]|uniref:uncharacterized protein LOC143048080 n=1 Tax=Mytilus galloprovincialis TaxID=29158 RepID=UPI003F7C8F5A
MKGLLATFIIHVILVDTVLSLSESDSCDGEHCGSVISMPIMDNMKASLKADLDVSKMNKYLKAYIEQEIEKGVKIAMENIMKQMIENKTEKMELLIKNKSEEMLTLFEVRDEKSKASFEVKMEEFKQKFEQKNKLNYAFFSHLSSTKTNLKQNTIVIFDVVRLNIGSAYDGTTGKFTCKEDGVYTFSWTTLSNAKQDFTSALVVDGTPIASNVVDNESTDDALSGSIRVIVKMTKGQEAWIKAVGSQGDYVYGSWYGSIPSSVFSGFKI